MAAHSAAKILSNKDSGDEEPVGSGGDYVILDLEKLPKFSQRVLSLESGGLNSMFYASRYAALGESDSDIEWLPGDRPIESTGGFLSLRLPELPQAASRPAISRIYQRPPSPKVPPSLEPQPPPPQQSPPSPSPPTLQSKLFVLAKARNSSAQQEGTANANASSCVRKAGLAELPCKTSLEKKETSELSFQPNYRLEVLGRRRRTSFRDGSSEPVMPKREPPRKKCNARQPRLRASVANATTGYALRHVEGRGDYNEKEERERGAHGGVVEQGGDVGKTHKTVKEREREEEDDGDGDVNDDDDDDDSDTVATHPETPADSRKWSKEEDEKLLACVARRMTFQEIAPRLPRRTWVACRSRFGRLSQRSRPCASFVASTFTAAEAASAAGAGAGAGESSSEKTPSPSPSLSS